MKRLHAMVWKVHRCAVHAMDLNVLGIHRRLQGLGVWPSPLVVLIDVQRVLKYPGMAFGQVQSLSTEALTGIRTQMKETRQRVAEASRVVEGRSGAERGAEGEEWSGVNLGE